MHLPFVPSLYFLLRYLSLISSKKKMENIGPLFSLLWRYQGSEEPLDFSLDQAISPEFSFLWL